MGVLAVPHALKNCQKKIQWPKRTKKNNDLQSNG